ncbi:MAG: hybrid sensor histidine kinase/response regulator [Leptospirillum sp.]
MHGIEALRSRLRENNSQEHEQAFIRLAIGILGSLYLLALPSGGDRAGQLLLSIHRYSIFFFLSLSVLILVSIFYNPRPSPARKILGIFLDLSTASFVMATSGEHGLPMGVIYLWVIMGNGFRYGLPYLALATSVSFVGLLSVFFLSPFWRSHPTLFWSQFLAIVVLPLYMAVLLEKQKKLIDMANEANRAKSRFLANMSHELRTPLNGIIGMGEILLSKNPTEKQRGLIETMQASANNLVEMIEKILDFSKIEAGRVVSESRRFNLDHFVYQTLSSIEPLAINKSLPIKVVWDGRLPVFVNGDSSHLRQILINLLGNGVKFTSEGSVSLSIRLAFDDPSGSRVRFEVSDTGIGIPESMKPRIFERFMQGDESVTKRFGGTGLGLSYARQLVELLGGDIGFQSKEGVGSTFWFEVPFGRADLPEPSLTERVPRIFFWGHHEDFGHYAEILSPFADDLRMIPAGATSLFSFEPNELRGVFVAKIDSSNRDLFRNMLSDKENAGILSVMLKVLVLSDGLPEPSPGDLTVGGSYVMTRAFPDRMERAISLWSFEDGHMGAQESTAPVIAPAGRALRILVAEDNTVNQRVVEGILTGAGHMVRIVSDGEMALDCLESESFDLMVLDLCMPVMGGLDVLKTHHFMEGVSPVPAIILSANATKEAADSCYEARAKAFLTKPIQISLLLSEIDRIASRGNGPVSFAPNTSSVSVQDPSLLDKGILGELEKVSSDPQFIRILLQGFVSDGERLLSLMEDSLVRCDFPEFMDAVHGLKGSGIQIGAQKLVKFLSDTESMEISLILSGRAMFVMDRIREVFFQTASEIRRFVDGESDLVDDSRKKWESFTNSRNGIS